jgi:tetratricopeptide (TPR) repeat protein
MLLDSGQVDRARQCSELALDLDPKLASAWAVRARTSRAGGDMQAALADYHRALAEEPRNQAILLEVAELYARTNEPQKALATLHTLADTYPPGEEPQQVLYQQGLAYRAVGRAADAAESLAAAADRDDPSTEILYRLAEAELAAGQRERAARAAWQALALDPEHAASRELLVRLGAKPGAARPLRR